MSYASAPFMLKIVPTPALTLAELLAACQRHERLAQRRFYGQFYGFALGVCQRYARHREQAMEVVNDGFVKAFRELPRFDPGQHPADLAGSLRGWLKRIMIHTAIDHYRAEQRQPSTTDFDAVAYAQADDQPTALDQLSYDELLAVVQRLPPAYRTVFNLAVLDGYSHEEIAAHLRISVGTSKSNLFKARAHLRTLLLAQSATSKPALAYVVE